MVVVHSVPKQVDFRFQLQNNFVEVGKFQGLPKNLQVSD